MTFSQYDDGMVHILVGVAYFLAAKTAMLIASTHPGVIVVWFPAGIALAAMLILGIRAWPVIFVGAFLELMSIGHVGSALVIATGKTLEAVLGAALVNRYAGGRRAFARARDILTFVVLAGLVTTQIGPTVGVLSLALGGLLARPDEAGMWFTWWLGDVAGVLLVTPFIMLWTDSHPSDWSRRHLAIAAALLVALAFGGVATFGTVLPHEMTAYPLTFLCMPALISAAYRLGPRGAATGVMIFAFIASRGTLRGFGPFGDAPPHEGSLLLLGYLGVMQVLILALAAEGKRARTGEASARLAAIVHASDDAIIGLDGDGRIVSWNPGAQRMFGFPPDEAVGRLYSEMVAPAHPAGKAELSHLLSRLHRGESVPPYDIEREAKGGRPVYVSASASAIQDDSGRFVGASLILRDITGRKLYEDALSHLASLAGGLPIAVIELDTDFRLLYLNGVAEKIFPDLVQLGPRHPLVADVRPTADAMRKTDQRRQVTMIEHDGRWYDRHLVMPHPGLLRLYVLDSACRPGATPPCVVREELSLSEGRGG